MSETNQYDQQADAWLTRYGVTFTASHAQSKPASWGTDRWDTTDQHWIVTLAPAGDRRRRLTFDFWNSRHDTDQGLPLRAYSVLSSLASDSTYSDDPDEIADELGPMKPSQAIAAAKWSGRIRKWLEQFSQEAIEALREIQ